MKSSPRLQQLEKAKAQQWRPNTEKINNFFLNWKQQRCLLINELANCSVTIWWHTYLWKNYRDSDSYGNMDES